MELLSDSTRRTDLGEKRNAYLTIPSFKVLILAESETPAVIVQRRKSEGGFAVEAHSGLDAIIPLPEIDASLPLAELYDQVVFS
jgi:Uma2 family endonuclease